MKHLRFLAYMAPVLFAAILTVNFSFRQENFISVVGKAVYDMREYPSQRVKVYVTEDGKAYKTFYCDEKGRFETRVQLNHNYLFHFSMDYHATSRVSVDTHVPESVSGGSVGGLFSFDCEMFERMEGLNLSILNNPLVMIKYNKEKKDFQYDKEYTEKILFNLEGFREQLAEMKQRRKEVLKDGSSKQPVAKEEKTEEKAERKPIVFDEEPRPKKAVNKRGHRNILDPDPEEELPAETTEEPVLSETPPADSREDEPAVASGDQRIPAVKDDAEELFLEEEIDESDFVSLNVIPKRVEIKPVQVGTAEKPDSEMEAIKIRVQEAVESKRVEEEKRIRNEVTSLNTKAAKQRELHLTNKKIQTQRIQNLIKTVALAEIYYKKDYYKRHPINHNRFIPGVIKRQSDGFWIDMEELTVRYPGSTVVLKKETFLFGISFYYRNGEEIDENVYCSAVSHLTSAKSACAQ